MFVLVSEQVRTVPYEKLNFSWYSSWLPESCQNSYV